MRHTKESGIALIMTMLVLMLISAMLVGFTTVVMTDQRYRFIDKDRGRAFYAASGAMEKLTADLGNLFLKNVALTNAQVTALTATSAQPPVAGVSYTSANTPQPLPASALSTYHCNNSDGTNRTPLTVGTPGYTISFCALTSTNNPTPTPDPKVVTGGPFEGLMALKTPYQFDVTATSTTGGEVHLARSIEAVSIPVFQFGIFSDVNLAFNAGDDFSFGGRVHTNGNLFLAEAAGATLTLSDKVTAAGEVVRKYLSNGVAITVSGHTGTVNMAKAPSSYRALATTEGSVVDGPASAKNEPTWTTTSLSTYKGYIKNGRTGAKQLNLPLVTAGGVNTDLVRRPLAVEDTSSFVFQERLFGKASLRVLLSDTSADISGLPTIDPAQVPLSLEAGNTYGGIPIARSPGTLSAMTVATGSSATTIKVSPSIDGFFQVSTYAIAAVSGAGTFSITACTAKTTTQFSGCTVTQTGGPAGSIAATGAAVTASVNGAGVSTTTSANPAVIAPGANKTIKVASTAGFSPQTFWIDDTLATCLAYDTTTVPPQFASCTTAGTPTTGHAITTFALLPQNTSPVGGFIKVERQNADGTWHDVSVEILGWGIGAPSQSGACDTTANDPSPNAIIRLQRLHDSGQSGGAANCTPVAGASSYDYWPGVLYDTRESVQRDAAPASGKLKLNGVMHYVTIDAANLAKWFTGAAPYAAGTGTQARLDNGGYSLYISDRRNNRNAASKETAEYGWEDFVNPASATGAPNSVLDAGEDVNGDGSLDVYGGTPNCNGQYGLIVAGGITCANAYFTTTSGPTTDLATGAETFTGTGRAMVNRPILFRRAVKLLHGATLGATLHGLTIVSENPVYIQGDWNANGAFNDPHAATSVLADAVTLLSNSWTDPKSFSSPYSPSGRPRSANSYYRVAVLAGKGAIFPQPAGTGATFGTDGGAHVFLRFLEGTGSSPDTVHYRGSLVTFYYNRQASGVFKGGGTVVYAIPSNRDYAFDVDFQTPSLLPPLTPMFRDMNAVGFSQELRPGK